MVDKVNNTHKTGRFLGREENLQDIQCGLVFDDYRNGCLKLVGIPDIRFFSSSSIFFTLIIKTPARSSRFKCIYVIWIEWHTKIGPIRTCSCFLRFIVENEKKFVASIQMCLVFFFALFFSSPSKFEAPLSRAHLKIFFNPPENSLFF